MCVPNAHVFAYVMGTGIFKSHTVESNCHTCYFYCSVKGLCKVSSLISEPNYFYTHLQCEKSILCPSRCPLAATLISANVPKIFRKIKINRNSLLRRGQSGLVISSILWKLDSFQNASNLMNTPQLASSISLLKI